MDPSGSYFLFFSFISGPTTNNILIFFCVFPSQLGLDVEPFKIVSCGRGKFRCSAGRGGGGFEGLGMVLRLKTFNSLPFFLFSTISTFSLYYYRFVPIHFFLSK